MSAARRLLALTALLALAPPTGVQAGAAQDGIIAQLAAQARAADPAFAGFSAERGQAFWAARHAGGKDQTPSCASCHGAAPRAAGQTRAGKAIEPMAVSLAPDRFTDPAKVAKWFQRNCEGVLGRECTVREKGDFLAYVLSQ